MDAETLEARIDRQLENLRREFAGAVAPETVNEIGAFHYEKLCADAKIEQFIPVSSIERRGKSFGAGPIASWRTLPGGDSFSPWLSKTPARKTD